MSKHYKDYIWNEGLPFGIQALNTEDSSKTGISYKIVSDPYHKRNSIEKYTGGIFSSVIYDSALFDFRHLKPAMQTAWQKTTILEQADSSICHIRNQDDRLILIEEYKFKQDRCVFCKASSPLGNLLSIQHIHYKDFGDSFNGVTLFDSNEHPVLVKKYEWDVELGEFSKLLSEEWDMKLSC